MAGKYCMNCGTLLPESAIYCYKCGTHQESIKENIVTKKEEKQTPKIVLSNENRTIMYDAREFENRLELLLNNYGFESKPKEKNNQYGSMINNKSLSIDGCHEISYSFYQDLALKSVHISVQQKNRIFANQQKNTVITKDDAINQISKMLLCVLIAIGENMNDNDLLRNQLIVANKESKQFKFCKISSIFHCWDIEPELQDCIIPHSEVNLTINPIPLIVEFDQFEINLKKELSLLGLSTKRESDFWVMVTKKQSNTKDTVKFTSPNNSSFSCTVIDGKLKEIQLNFSCYRMNESAVKKYANTMGKYYYACALAIERDHASKESDNFINLRNVHLQHFHGNVWFVPNSPTVRISMIIQ